MNDGKLAILDAVFKRQYSRRMASANRTLYLVCYDIRCPRRLYRTHRYLLGYKVGGQKSFFECWLTPTELRDVQLTLQTLLLPSEDRAHIFQLDPRQRIESLGIATPPPVAAFMIV